MRVAVFGAGIAGLTAAHELARRGHEVLVVEPNRKAGGFFRSDRGEGHTPTEYSWHGLGPWYHNTFALLREIPLDEHGSIYDRGLSRPIDFGVATDDGKVAFDDTRWIDPRHLFRMTNTDALCWAWWMLKQWTAGRRSVERYSRRRAADVWERVLSRRAARVWRATFGPWIGSDWTNVSWHQAGLFFRKQLISGHLHLHPADEAGPEWVQRSRSGWLLFRGPSNEVWFDPWVAYLKRLGVRFRWGDALERLEYDGQRIRSAELASGETIVADAWIIATHPFAAAEIVARTPALAQLSELCLLDRLIQDGPHVQVSFRIAFAERLYWPRPRAALVIADSEFDLTMFAQEQAWTRSVDLGEGVASLWTATACVATVPGRLHGLPLVDCTKEQFVDEVLAQLRACGGLDRLLREANGGRSWQDVPIVGLEVWHEWDFSSDGIDGPQPKWVNSTRTQPWQPGQRTPVPNLVLAGAHTRTDADLWSIEAAVESGRRAARCFEPDVKVIPEWVPPWIRTLRRLDDLCYAVGAPHVLDLALGALALLSLWGIGGSWWRRAATGRPRRDKPSPRGRHARSAGRPP